MKSLKKAIADALIISPTANASARPGHFIIWYPVAVHGRAHPEASVDYLIIDHYAIAIV